MVYFLLADGFEESEAIVPFDILKRAGLECTLAHVGMRSEVTGSHGLKVKTDISVKEVRPDRADAIILPGGMPGAKNLDSDRTVDKLIKEAYDMGILIGAICAAPLVLGKRRLLSGKKAVCYPGYEKYLEDAEILDERVVRDGNIITAKGAGAAFEFGYALAAHLKDVKTAEKIMASVY